MNMDKLYKMNKIEKQILELEEEKQYYHNLIISGNDNEEIITEFTFLDDQIDELMVRREQLMKG